MKTAAGEWSSKQVACGPLMLGSIHAASGGFQAGMTFLTAVTCLLLVGAVWLRTAAR